MISGFATVSLVDVNYYLAGIIWFLAFIWYGLVTAAHHSTTYFAG